MFDHGQREDQIRDLDEVVERVSHLIGIGQLEVFGEHVVHDIADRSVIESVGLFDLGWRLAADQQLAGGRVFRVDARTDIDQVLGERLPGLAPRWRHFAPVGFDELLTESFCERRKLLLKAAYGLLCTHPVEDISFRDIADEAGVPEGSAYHFFANRFDLFSALAEELSEQFIEAHRCKVPPSRRKTWQALAEHLVDVGAGVYAENPPARQLLIGGKTPPEVKQADRLNDRAVGHVMYEVFAEYFELPDTDEIRNAFYYFIEITDLLFTLSVIEHGEITPAMLAEAKRAGIGYLSTYLE